MSTYEIRTNNAKDLDLVTKVKEILERTKTNLSAGLSKI